MDPLDLARQSLIFACDLGALGQDDTRLSRAAQRGMLVRVKHGVYLDRVLWDPLVNADRHRLLATVAERLAGPGLVFSHQTAAALLGLPVLGRWPDRAHVLKECADGGRSTTVVLAHTVGLRDVPVTMMGALTMTTPARTVVDIAAHADFEVAVVVMDAALHRDRRTRRPLTTRADVSALIELMSPFRGLRRVLAVLDASTPLSESVGESLCRIILSELGLGDPELQVEFRDADGLIGFADFTWRLDRVILEFDGQTKYLDARYRHGLSADQIVVLEKLREDRLRALGYRVVRAVWKDLVDPARLLRLLTDAGLVPVRTTRVIRRDWL
ncbi:hypothetical protein D6T64_14805 [Cryobacterium melibiosiphilum]|uniref:DUF559 domain-containing protein n=1 Tax=Cryobacterium melibiosiphilum TaxID=995039 RepID=A0A3A5MJV0_9MICO|nr:type IV toxin-antitoxin system AbiEi family antitoxin domain-containing protein [Cryobacterium melibiosiphilum]RJT87308.1 hypothetical protein D6T64_14805 [Cryobacterium melibiosiphilum]